MTLQNKVAFEGHFANQSRRRSSATWLFQSSVPKQVIVEITGHRSFDGLENILYIVNTSMKTKLKRMSREKRKSCLGIMLNTMRKKKWV